MKCINCKKEVVDGNIYCVHCGEKLANINNIDDEYNYDVDNQKVYEDIGDKVNQYGTTAKEKLPGYYEKLKTIISKNKIATIIGSVVIVAVILGIGIFSFMQGRPMDDKQLQSYLIGQKLMVDGDSYEIKDGQLKSLVVTSRNSVKKKSDEIEGEVTMDLDNATIVANIKFQLSYNTKNKKWKFNGLRSSYTKSIEPKVDLNDSIKDLLKDATINYNYNSIDLKKGLLKDIGNIDINGTGVKRDGTAVLKLSNGVVESTVSANFAAQFNLKEGKWMVNSDNLHSEIIQNEKISDNLSDEDKKKFALTAFKDNRRYTYKYKYGDSDYSESINLMKDNISDLKINNFMEYDKDTIRIEVLGQATNGDISKINFSGVIYLDLSLTEDNNCKTEINIDSVELASINLDTIKKDMLKYTIDNKPITVDIANTFSLGSENKDSRMFNKVYEGTITINGVVESVKSRIYLKYNEKDKKYEWKLDSIYVIKK